MQKSLDAFHSRQQLTVDNKKYTYFSIPEACKNGLGDAVAQLPFSLKVLLENLLRYEDNVTVNKKDIEAMAAWLENGSSKDEIAYRPARVLMQDFTGVPAIVDLAAMRDAMKDNGGDPDRINPLSRVDLVIDHSVQVDQFADKAAFEFNVRREMERNKERYAFLHWGQNTFKNFNVVPPGTGICHQVNLEHLAKAVWSQDIDSESFAFPDTLVGTDSHTTMINGLGVLGWGVGGIEAEAAMLGQPISMLIPEVIGFELIGKVNEGITATDLVLTVTEILRQRGVVGKFVEFYGEGLNHLPLADRATIANMAPEYGATCGFFPIDEETIKYMRLTGRDDHTCALTKAYCQAQGMWRDSTTPAPKFTDSITLDLTTVTPSLAGPKRPQDRVELSGLTAAFDNLLAKSDKANEINNKFQTEDDFDLHHGDVVIAAITSCTNTSNPSILMAAGLLAKKALARGLQRKPWVKTSLAPGSKVVTDYLRKAGLQAPLDELGFNLVGYGCTTCIGNSGPLPEAVANAIDKNQLVVSSVLSGNRNFEGRVHPQVKANWLASPPLVVAYAIAGTTRTDLSKDPLGDDSDGNPVYLSEIWPSQAEIQEAVLNVDVESFRKEYADVFTGDENWRNLEAEKSQTYDWQADSTYVKRPPFFDNLTDSASKIGDIQNARILALLGDSITTDHISPAGAIKAISPAGEYLQANGVEQYDFNSYGSRRGNHEVMMRGTFANIRIRNEMTPEKEGGYTKHIPTGDVMSIFDAAMRYQEENTPLVIFAGKEYGTGSSRDWAAKGTRLLGVRAVVTESFERIHRSNLIGMGVLPCQFTDGATRESLALKGDETVSIKGINTDLKPGATLDCVITRADGTALTTPLLVRIDTENEMRYYQVGGILNYVLLQMLAKH